MDVVSCFFRSLKSKPDTLNRHIFTHFMKDRNWSCPSCGYLQEENSGPWPGLPAGLKFEPSDEELIRHLRAKLRVDNCAPHPLLDDFIPTLEVSQGICYTHPEKLPGISRDGSKRHFFHTHAKAYKNGNRKRRRIEDDYDYRWHKTGKTRRVLVDGKQLGFKKILVLYSGENGETHKTKWVMHQYHLGKDENEKDGELVVSKIFYQINNSTAFLNFSTKQPVAETCKPNTFATRNSENSVTEPAVAETYGSCSIGIKHFESNTKLCKVAGSDAAAKTAIPSENSLISLKNETDDDAVFGGIERNSSFVNKGCFLSNEGKDFTEWLHFYWFESQPESLHNMNGINSFLASFPL